MTAAPALPAPAAPNLLLDRLLDPREIVRVEADRWSGALVEFACGHVVWWAIAPTVGDRRFCSVCVDGVILAIRAERDVRNGAPR